MFVFLAKDFFSSRNADNLGGDPNRITIGGQSEGGSHRDDYFRISVSVSKF